MADGLDSLARAVVERFARPARAFVFGGLLRNAVLSQRFGRSLPLRDLDIVVFGLSSDEELETRFERDPRRRNSFGGLKVEVLGAVVDIWRAELQLQIAGAGSLAATLESFLRCVTLTTDAVLFDVSEGLLYETGFLRSIQEEIIDVGAASRWLPHWVGYHLAHLAYVIGVLIHVVGSRLFHESQLALRMIAACVLRFDVQPPHRPLGRSERVFNGPGPPAAPSASTRVPGRLYAEPVCGVGRRRIGCGLLRPLRGAGSGARRCRNRLPPHLPRQVGTGRQRGAGHVRKRSESARIRVPIIEGASVRSAVQAGVFIRDGATLVAVGRALLECPDLPSRQGYECPAPRVISLADGAELSAAFECEFRQDHAL